MRKKNYKFSTKIDFYNFFFLHALPPFFSQTKGTRGIFATIIYYEKNNYKFSTKIDFYNFFFYKPPPFFLKQKAHEAFLRLVNALNKITINYENLADELFFISLIARLQVKYEIHSKLSLMNFKK